MLQHSLFILNDVLQHLFIESEIGHHFLQPAALGLDLLQPSKLRDTQAAVLLLPVVKGRLRNTELAAYLFNSSPRLRLTQRKCDLLFRVPRLLNPAIPPSPQGK